MEIEQSVDYILSTYDLPWAKRNRVARLAKQTLREQYQLDFDEQYALVARLVDSMTVNDRERNSYCSRRRMKSRRKARLTRYVRPYEPTDQFLETPAEDNEQTKAAFTVLWSGLDTRRYEFIKSMWRVAGQRMLLNPRLAQRELPNIKQRLRQLESNYLLGDRILVPLRPIRRIRFNPFSIEFRKRKIDGDPVGYLERYRRVYGEISKYELFQVDQGLYQALRSAGKMEEAFQK